MTNCHTQRSFPIKCPLRFVTQNQRGLHHPKVLSPSLGRTPVSPHLWMVLKSEMRKVEVHLGSEWPRHCPFSVLQSILLTAPAGTSQQPPGTSTRGDTLERQHHNFSPEA